ncbi:MAG: MopE-related protein [Byssovorax sp.]
MSKVKHLVALLAALCVALFSQRAHATHFRYGNITYSIPDPTHPLTVRFEVTTAWRAAFVGTSALNFGDGQSNPATQGVEIGSGFDASGLEYKFQRYVISHTYAQVGQYTAFFTDCCRLSNLVNAGDNSFRVEAKVDIAPGNKGNPITQVPAIIQLQTGGVRTIFIPATDPDGTAVSCRFATTAESLITTIPPVTAGTGAIPTIAPSANPPGCQITWNLNGASPSQQYAVAVMLETTNPQNNKINSANIDFITELVLAPPPTCTGSGTFIIPMGSAFSTDVIGTNVAGGPNLTMNWLGSNGLVTPLSGSTKPSPFKSTLTWTPGLGEEGTYNSTIVYTDNHSESGYCSLTLIVPPCPQFGEACSVGVGQCQKNGIKQCIGNNVVCNAVAGQPQAEICDGLDNNCDGTVDEGNPGAGQDCMSGLPGVCSPGVTNCAAGGVLQCVPDVSPGTLAETCNGSDDDCNGTVDDGFNVGSMCADGVGACRSEGTVSCDAMGGAVCSAVAGSPQPEICNGADDNCDGTVDEGFDLGGDCTSGVGACQVAGVFVCNAMGAVVCGAKAGMPSAEVCGNAVDEDCDGALDNGCVDSDGDGLFDPVEKALGLDPTDPDSDDDGVLDGDEPDFDKDTDGDGLINALDPDSDNDGLFDGTELGLGCDHAGTDAAKHHCRPDADQGATKTDPLAYDTDKGGVSDGSEDGNLNGKVDPGELDPQEASDDANNVDADKDGLSDGLEAFLGTNPGDIDSDDDGWPDGEEANPSDDTDGDGLINLLDVDSDNDALPDGQEVGNNCLGAGVNQAAGHCRPDANHGATKTNPLKADTDGGGVIDGSEDSNLDGIVDPGEGDPNSKGDDKKVKDADKDGLSDALEVMLGASPNDADSDDDGLLDGEEPNPADDHDGDGKKNVMDADSDGDGLFDGTEAGKACGDPDTSASAHVCIADADDASTTGVLQADTDKGGVKDGVEDENHNGKFEPPYERDPNLASDDADMPPACTGTDDARCGGPQSGKVCDGEKCVPGCRGKDGNGCPATQECTSTDSSIGTCKEPSGEGGAGGDGSIGGDTGCSCDLSSTAPDTFGGVLLLLGVAAAGARRRRR